MDKLTYIDLIPNELLGYIVPLDKNGDELFNLIEAYPYFKDHIIENFLKYNYISFYKALNAVSKHFNIKISEAFEITFNFLMRQAGWKGDDFMEAYEIMLYKFTVGVVFSKESYIYSHRDILLSFYLLFNYIYPNIINYYNQNINKNIFIKI